MRNTTGKIGRPVNRINDPDLGTDVPATFFTKEGVLRKIFRNCATDMGLGGRVRHGQKILRTFHGNTAFGLSVETLENQVSCRTNNRTAKVGASLERIGVMQAFHEITIKSI
ncbi:hypothetical protein D3C80_1542510 [compost metagenome]